MYMYYGVLKNGQCGSIHWFAPLLREDCFPGTSKIRSEVLEEGPPWGCATNKSFYVFIYLKGAN